MRDEEYVYYQDLREKKTTGYSARKQRTHCGKGGRVKFPSDYLTKKEIKNMSGEVKSYRLNEPMTFEEFRSMPDDLQETYLKAIRERYNASDTQIAKMMYTSQASLRNYLAKKGLNRSGRWSGKEVWDKEGFMAWAYGIPKKEETLEEILEETQGECVECYETVEEPVEVIEEETPVTEEVTFEEVPKPCIKINLVKEDDSSSINFAVPASGTLTFKGTACEIMNTINRLLGNAKIAMEVQWTALED